MIDAKGFNIQLESATSRAQMSPRAQTPVRPTQYHVHTVERTVHPPTVQQPQIIVERQTVEPPIRRSVRSAVTEGFKTKVRNLVDAIPAGGRVIAHLSRIVDWKTHPDKIKYMFEHLPARVELLNMSGGETMVWGEGEVDALIKYLQRSRVYYINAGKQNFNRGCFENACTPRWWTRTLALCFSTRTKFPSTTSTATFATPKPGTY